MAGIAENLAPMWKVLREDLDLEPPVPSTENPYLGSNQKVVDIEDEVVQQKSTFFQTILNILGNSKIL